MRRPPFTAMKISGTYFCYRQSRLQGINSAGRIRSIENSNDLIGNRTRDPPAYSIVSQPTTLQRAPTVYTFKFRSKEDLFNYYVEYDISKMLIWFQ
jgi:hypothetical protein